MTDTARPHRRPRPSVSVLIAATALLLGGLLLAGCGGGSKAASSTTTSTSTAPSTSTTETTASSFGDTYLAPKTYSLKLGQSVVVSAKAMSTIGWQASCFADGRRINAEAVRGQVTRAGRIVSFKGGSPSIWITYHPDNSITIHCR